jgi:hypothetical protein
MCLTAASSTTTVSSYIGRAVVVVVAAAAGEDGIVAVSAPFPFVFVPSFLFALFPLVFVFFGFSLLYHSRQAIPPIKKK